MENWEDARTKSTSAPKVSIISAPQDYTDMDRNQVKAESMDICCRAISVGALHKAYPMTVAVGTGAAARIPGTLVNETAAPAPDQEIIRIGHSSGVTEVDVKMEGETVVKGGVTRTARRIMDFRNGIDTMTTESACLSSIWITDEKTRNYFEIHHR